jgi:hypothetical protein
LSAEKKGTKTISVIIKEEEGVGTGIKRVFERFEIHFL